MILSWPSHHKTKTLKKALKKVNKRRKKLDLPKIRVKRIKMCAVMPRDLVGYLAR
jgi:hypothetical protein